jgi:ABC-type phosphate transport system substrate-binding protein
MRKLGVRAGLLAGASAAVLAIGGVTAGGAMATPTCPQPTVNIQGMGSSLQRVSEELWTGRVVPSATGLPIGTTAHTALVPATGYAITCGSSPAVSYTSTGSGPALKAWRFTGSGSIETESKTLAFIGSDDAPTAAQIKNAEEATSGGVATGAKPIIVPVMQTSISVPVNMPAECVPTGGITYQDLNNLFNGTIKKWSELSTVTEPKKAKCITEQGADEIERVVRNEGSGTTYQFKNYLSVLETTTGIKAAGPGCELGTWAALREIAAEEKPNITWPSCAGRSTIHKAAGGGAVAEYVKLNANTIGYAALPDAKGKGAAVASLQNGEPEGSKTYAEPGKEVEEANCGSRVYTVPVGGRSGEGAEAIDWSGVFGASPKVGSAYPLCTLTYAIGWSKYSKAGFGTEAEALKTVENVKAYLTYVLNEAQGIKHWYAGLPNGGGVLANNVLGAGTTAVTKLNK